MNILGWFNYEKIYKQAVDSAKDGDNFLEIGCFLGKSTHYLCELIASSNKKINLYVMDLFVAQPIECESINISPGEDLLPLFTKNLQQYIDKINIIKGDSLKEYERFTEGFFNFIFIDGNHEYESVKLDLNNYYPKLKTGGIFAGHDYTENCGVPIAVNEFAEKNKKNILTIDTSWLLIK